MNSILKRLSTSLTRQLPMALAMVGALCTSGCDMGKFMADQAFKSAGKAGQGVQTIHDYETIKKIAMAGMGQLEGLHAMSPNNPAGLQLLMKAWAGVGSAFIWDEYELAFDNDDDAEMEYQKLRAQAAFKRAKFFGERLMAQKVDDFDEIKQSGAKEIRAWLKLNFTDEEDAPLLLWYAFASINAVGANTHDSALISELYVSEEFFQRVVELDEGLENALAHIVLGGFYARPFGEPERGKKHLDRALELTGGKFTAVQLATAITYDCQTHNKENYIKNLQAVMGAPDPLPEQRVGTVVARRKAYRYLHNPAWQDECGFTL
ncbi:MAG: hypothetical protein HRU17_19930 [Polyangiaceae bacterium]|nr:hypothetical protein [Polyangiaceae bacterium]